MNMTAIGNFLDANGIDREDAARWADTFDFTRDEAVEGFEGGALTVTSNVATRTIAVEHYRLDGEGFHDHGQYCGCAACAGEQENPMTSLLDSIRAALEGDVEAATDTSLDMSFVGDALVEMAALLTSYTSGLGNYGGFESDFNIEIIFEGTWTEELQEAFISSAEYLSYLIQGDVSDTNGGIDDVRITATLGPIDGSGGILGQAGPTSFRIFEGFIPSQGIMEFDVADAQDFDDEGLFDDIVTHEMLHVLGVGTLWELQGDTEGSIASGDLNYTGFNSRVAYNVNERDVARNDPDSRQGVPIETDGGPGTAGGHWDDELFEDELMTGFISDSNYVSSLTIANLEDIGYDTIWDWRDPRADYLQPDEFVAIYG